MKRSTKIALAVSSVLAIPALAFAGSSNFGSAIYWMGGNAMGSMRGGMGSMHVPFSQNGSGVTVPAKIRETLAASGVTLPGDAEISSAHATMQKIATARKAFAPADADTAALKAIRQEAAKKERDYLRSKGVTLPSEEEISKAEATHQSMAKAMETLRPSMKSSGKKGGKNSDSGRGRHMMGDGFGMGPGMMDDDDFGKSGRMGRWDR